MAEESTKSREREIVAIERFARVEPRHRLGVQRDIDEMAVLDEKTATRATR